MNFNFGRGVLGRKLVVKLMKRLREKLKSITPGNTQLLPMLMMEQELHFLAVAVRRIL